MKTMIRSAVLFLFCIAISMAYAGVPPISVSVSDASGNAAFKGATNSTGAFATGKLKPGSYVVQLNAKSPAVKGNHYAVVVSAGKKKVAASAVAGEKFNGGGVALKVRWTALDITGQVAEESKAAMKTARKWFGSADARQQHAGPCRGDSAEAKEARDPWHVEPRQVQRIQSSQTNDNRTGAIPIRVSRFTRREAFNYAARRPVWRLGFSAASVFPTAEGFEPTHPCEYWILSPARLPFRQRRPVPLPFRIGCDARK